MAAGKPSDELSPVLLVDDRPENLTALEAVIMPLGVRVTSVTSGEAALRHLLEEDVALILLDVQMPGLDGFATARLIKGHPRTAHIPIIFLTAFDDRVEHVEEGYTSGAVDFIVKPFEPWVLRSKVRVFLDLHRKTRLLAQQAAALAANVAELRASRAALADAQRMAQVGSWELDCATDAVVGSEQLHVIFGWPVDEPLPLAAQLFTQLRVPPADPPVLPPPDLRHPPARVSVEAELVRPDGEVRDVVVNAEPVLDEAGRCWRVVGTAQDVTEQREAHRALEGTRRQLERERELVQLLQETMAPGALPGVPELDVAACYRPAGAGLAGGDWYDVISSADGQVLLVIGDVAGRGVAAASTMAQIRAAVRAIALREWSPGAILADVHRYLHHSGLEVFATMLVARLDPSSGRGRVASAGHLPIVTAGAAGSRIEWVDSGPPLGSGVIGPYGEHDVALEPGGAMVLYTDGLVERRTEGIDESIARLGRCLEDSPGGDSRQLVDWLTGRLCDDDASVDDIALLVVRRRPPMSELSLSLAADPDHLAAARQCVRRWLAAYAVDDDDVGDVVLAVSELLTNACLHAYPPLSRGPVVVTGEVLGDRVRVEVRDRGRWRARTPHGGGRGLALVRAMGMELEVEAGRDGTTATVEATVRRRRHGRSPAA